MILMCSQVEDHCVKDSKNHDSLEETKQIPFDKFSRPVAKSDDSILIYDSLQFFNINMLFQPICYFVI